VGFSKSTWSSNLRNCFLTFILSLSTGELFYSSTSISSTDLYSVPLDGRALLQLNISFILGALHPPNSWSLLLICATHSPISSIRVETEEIQSLWRLIVQNIIGVLMRTNRSKMCGHQIRCWILEIAVSVSDFGWALPGQMWYVPSARSEGYNSIGYPLQILETFPVDLPISFVIHRSPSWVECTVRFKLLWTEEMPDLRWRWLFSPPNATQRGFAIFTTFSVWFLRQTILKGAPNFVLIDKKIHVDLRVNRIWIQNSKI
jgi:hypothetical protein